MSKAKLLTTRHSQILGRLQGFNDLLTVSEIGFNMNKIKPIIASMEHEVNMQARAAIKEAKKPVPARPAKAILKDIAESGKLTPELLEEIRRSKK